MRYKMLRGLFGAAQASNRKRVLRDREKSMEGYIERMLGKRADFAAESDEDRAAYDELARELKEASGYQHYTG
jgi:formiminotetrahydrofolate cyclodeaminase